MKDEDVSKVSNINAFKIATQTVAISGGISILLILIAILSLSTEKGDSAGAGFYLFYFCGLFIFAVSSIISLGIFVNGVIKGKRALSKNNNIRYEIDNAITKNIFLIFGIILLWVIIYKLLTNSVL
jgi:hypothetical protein